MTKFNVSIGRGHTAMGYWNQTFHHGKWFQTTTDRPAIYRFEDDIGILPVHLSVWNSAVLWTCRAGH